MSIKSTSKIFQLLLRLNDFHHSEKRSLKKNFFYLRDFLRVFYQLKISNQLSGVDKLEKDFIEKCYAHLGRSNSQLFQDIFALTINGSEKGYFVEFGATNGVKLNNTLLLEKTYAWQGILAEPGKGWHKELTSNRQCHIDKRCVYSASGEDVLFTQHIDPELSGITNLLSGTNLSEHDYHVQTVSLSDLLDGYHAPSVINYLSIDTEGSEFHILEAFDFSKYQFKAITIEHNYIDSLRKQVFDLLISKGYKRILTHLSAHDDWYVLA